jgi:hypothetical protein
MISRPTPGGYSSSTERLPTMSARASPVMRSALELNTKMVPLVSAATMASALDSITFSRSSLVLRSSRSMRRVSVTSRNEMMATLSVSRVSTSRSSEAVDKDRMATSPVARSTGRSTRRL